MLYPTPEDGNEALNKLSADPDARERAERREIELKLYEYGAAIVRAEGRLEGKKSALMVLLSAKFGELPAGVQARIAAAAEDDVDLWLKRLLSADTLAVVIGSEPLPPR